MINREDVKDWHFAHGWMLAALVLVTAVLLVYLATL